ncbi:hypothetical protein HYZ98_03650 [Candidatus Peregrinibacteria bacterium]|nr:hypothetical protein [Candidatus Peregrinibacteria bacterium]
MYYKSLFASAILITYLLITGAAFLYTIGRFRIPLLPWPLIHVSYTLMAPYQGDVPWNGVFIAEGELPDGRWTPIPLESYFPFIRGEASVRMALHSFQKEDSPAFLYAKYRELALKLLEQERTKGNIFDHIRIIYRTWPRSPEGYRTLYKEPFFLRNELVTLVP